MEEIPGLLIAVGVFGLQTAASVADAVVRDAARNASAPWRYASKILSAVAMNVGRARNDPKAQTTPAKKKA